MFNAVVGNPPFLGGHKITGLFGDEYREHLVEHLARGVRGRADLAAYFLHRMHDLAASDGQVGIVATNTLAQGRTREVGLDVIVAEGATIRSALKSDKWPGRASVQYCMVVTSKTPMKEGKAYFLIWSPRKDEVEDPDEDDVPEDADRWDEFVPKHGPVVANWADRKGVGYSVTAERELSLSKCVRCGSAGEVHSVINYPGQPEVVAMCAYISTRYSDRDPSKAAIVDCAPVICEECGVYEYPTHARNVNGRLQCRHCWGDWVRQAGSENLRLHVEACAEVECETCSGVLPEWLRRDRKHTPTVWRFENGSYGWDCRCLLWAWEDCPRFTTQGGAYLGWVEHAYGISIQAKTPEEPAASVDAALFDLQVERVEKPKRVPPAKPEPIVEDMPSLFDEVA